MADVDDELLALVGGDESSDDEGSEQAINISKSESGSPEPEEKDSAKKVPAKNPKKDYSDEEEGEAYVLSVAYQPVYTTLFSSPVYTSIPLESFPPNLSHATGCHVPLQKNDAHHAPSRP